RRHPNEINEDLRRFGISMEDLRVLARELGLEFVELTGRNGKRFLEFLGQLDEALGGATLDGTEAAGRLDRVRDTIRFSAAEESIGEVFRQLVEAAIGGGSGAGVLEGLFRDFDFGAFDSDNPEVRNAARDAARSIIEGIFGAISSDTLTKGELGGLIGDFSVGDFKGFLDELLGLIPDALDESGEQLATASERWADAVRNIGR